MTRTLILEEPVAAPDGAGGMMRGWRVLGTLWATIGTGSVREVDGVARVALKVTVRAAPVGSPSRPVAGQRFREGERILRIIGVTEGDRVLTCHVEDAT